MKCQAFCLVVYLASALSEAFISPPVATITSAYRMTPLALKVDLSSELGVLSFSDEVKAGGLKGFEDLIEGVDDDDDRAQMAVLREELRMVMKAQLGMSSEIRELREKVGSPAAVLSPPPKRRMWSVRAWMGGGGAAAARTPAVAEARIAALEKQVASLEKKLAASEHSAELAIGRDPSAPMVLREDDVCLIPGETMVRVEDAPSNSRRIFCATDIFASVEEVT